MGYVFISYSTANQESADAIRNLFSKHGFATWMAPYDIPPGQKYAEVINRAIKGCSCFTLLLTNQSQDSIWVSKEVERAVHYRKLLIPISLESVVLNDEFEFYISTDQIVPVRVISETSEAMQKILKTIAANLGVEEAPPLKAQPVPREATAPAVPRVTLDDPELDPSVTEPWDQYSMGFAYEFGQNKPQNYAIAAKWYQLAAQQEVSWAQHRLGEAYYHGRGVEKSYALAAYWYEKGAENNDHSCQYCIGNCYYHGRGVDKDLTRAFRWFSKAADQGLAIAQYSVGLCYEFGYGTRPDYVQAVFWYERAAKQNNAWAQHRLGDCYFHSRGVDRDYDNAFYWLKQSAEQGNKGAYPLLIECYEKGLGVPRNPELALFWKSKQQ